MKTGRQEHKAVPQEETEYVRCNLCGADDAEKLYEMPDVHFHPDEFFTVVRCRICGLGYLNPRPKQEALDKYYPKEFFNIFENEAAHYLKRYEREGFYVGKYAHRPNDRKPKLLDVGCANGGFLRHMRGLGWDVEGLEIGAEAREIKDFKVYNMLFSDLPVRTPSYDVVTAWAVMEHVHDPMAYFKKAHEILHPNGVFLFLVTNLDSLSSNGLFREDIPRHTYFYNERTVKSYLQKTGFDFIESAHKNDIWEMVPVGWLLHKLNRLTGRGEPRYKDIPQNFSQWIVQNRYQRTMSNFLKFTVAHPFVVLDRVTAPLYAHWQIMTGTYGISTYVARKK